jgi:hypothetical protein
MKKTSKKPALYEAQNSAIDRTIALHLQRAVTELRADMERLELCLAVLESAMQPLPDYESPYRRTRIPAEDVHFP